MLPDEDFLRELTRTVWTTVVGLEAEDAGSSEGPIDHEITSSVDISGGWAGTVSISFSSALGRRLATAMLQCTEEEATPAVVNDAIGGNVKAMLPGPSKLSLPRVDTCPPASGPTDHVERVWFDCEGRPFSVSIRTDPAASANLGTERAPDAGPSLAPAGRSSRNVRHVG
jgi:chemotaxis protein CheX